MADIPVNATTPVIVDNVTANGQVLFAFDFRVDRLQDIFAIYKTAGGAQTLLTAGVDFTVTGLGLANGGSISITSVATVIGSTVTIYRDIIIDRQTDYQDDLFSDDINREQDKTYMILQEFARDIDRTLKLPLGQTQTILLNPQNGYVLGWLNGQIVNISPTDFINIGGLAVFSSLMKAWYLSLPDNDPGTPNFPYKNGGTPSFSQ